ncbi:hypothetical protein LWI29_008515 [Acer saccharum]|uniref:Uncharacterized protein n=1 Tax=Acer saccharum TaxID=4024 RepID=A0AA39VHU0_ACESA|nr:hypothetical protein LWI29_008515 [Acer saccharum]
MGWLVWGFGSVGGGFGAGSDIIGELVVLSREGTGVVTRALELDGAAEWEVSCKKEFDGVCACLMGTGTVGVDCSFWSHRSTIAGNHDFSG